MGYWVSSGAKMENLYEFRGLHCMNFLCFQSRRGNKLNQFLLLFQESLGCQMLLHLIRHYVKHLMCALPMFKDKGAFLLSWKFFSFFSCFGTKSISRMKCPLQTSYCIAIEYSRHKANSNYEFVALRKEDKGILYSAFGLEPRFPLCQSNLELFFQVRRIITKRRQKQQTSAIASMSQKTIEALQNMSSNPQNVSNSKIQRHHSIHQQSPEPSTRCVLMSPWYITIVKPKKNTRILS